MVLQKLVGHIIQTHFDAHYFGYTQTHGKAILTKPEKINNLILYKYCLILQWPAMTDTFDKKSTLKCQK